MNTQNFQSNKPAETFPVPLKSGLLPVFDSEDNDNNKMAIVVSVNMVSNNRNK